MRLRSQSRPCLPLSLFVVLYGIVPQLSALPRAQAADAAQTVASSDAVSAQDLRALSGTNSKIIAAVQSGSASSPGLHAALVARRDLLKKLIRTDPADVPAYVLDPSVRSAIVAADPSATALLEQAFTVTGELVAAVADDFAHGTSTTLYTLHTFNRDISLSFSKVIPGLDRMTHMNVTAKGLGLDDVMVAESLRKATPAEIQQCQSAPVSAASVSTSASSAAPATCSTTGTQPVAVLLVSFPNNTPSFPAGFTQASYWTNVLSGSNPSVNGYWNEVSYGQTSASVSVFGPFALSQPYDCTTTSAMETAVFAAAAGTVNFSQFNRYIIVFPASTCNFDGLANIGCSAATSTISQQYSAVWIPIWSAYTPDNVSSLMWGVLSHELGHNLGLNHASSLDFGSITLGPLDSIVTVTGAITAATPSDGAESTAAVPISAISSEYGDPFSAMGNTVNAGPYSAEHRFNLLGWIPPSSDASVISSGTYDLAPAENSSGLRTLQVLRDPGSTSWLWVEYHQPTGYYTPNNLSAIPGNTLTTGAFIHYATATLDPLHTYLLDFAPTATPNNFADATLAFGQTWSDPYSLLTLKAGTGTSSSLPVTVSYDTPCASLSLSASELSAAGGSASLNIVAPSTCSWTVSSNASWISFPAATSGSGNATVSFNYSANSTTAQRNSYITAQRQSLPVVQDGPTLTVVGMTPVASSGLSQSFAVAIDDSAGPSDLADYFFSFYVGNCWVAVEMTGSSNNSAELSLYDLEQSGSSQVIQPGSSGTLSTSVCTLYGTGSSAIFSGNNLTLTFDLSFPASLSGLTLSASANAGLSGQVASGPFPLGIFSVSLPAAATPMIAPSGGTFTSVQIATITDSNSAATIYYSTDGSTPTTNSTQYTAPITVAQSETIEAIATATGDSPSAVASAAFTINLPVTATPGISPNGGTFSSPQTVTITDGTSGATIYYTTNGSVPTTSSTQYTSAINVGQSETIEAIATATGDSPSAVASAAFTIPPTFTLAGTSVTVTPGAASGNMSIITVTPEYAFTGNVTLTAAITSSPAGAQDTPTLSFGSSSPAAVTNGNPVTATLTITTSPQTTGTLIRPTLFRGRWGASGGVALASALLFGMTLRRRWLAYYGMILLVAITFTVLGCGGGAGNGTSGGGGGSPGTTPGSYTVTVTGTSGGQTQTTTISLTVN
jgi:Chitobiase/beta-hexosaminidase C-terminal domain/Viral BACON domain/Gametolysin peptidase M11